MASILSSILSIFSSTEDNLDESFIYFWDDVEEEEIIVEEETKSFTERIRENSTFIIHFLLILSVLPLSIMLLILATDSTILILSLSLSFLAILLILTSYLRTRDDLNLPLSILKENISQLSNYDLRGTDALLFAKERNEILDAFNVFRFNMSNLIKTYEINSLKVKQELELLQSQITGLYSQLDHVNLSIDNRVANTGVYQETRGYLGQISQGIDNFTDNFDVALTGIDEISTIVGSIGNQTTMLALNAGIEAARVGEFGKGFEVVAANLRRLSQHAKDSSVRIKTMSKDIDLNAKNALEEITAGMTNLTSKIDVTFESINSLNNEMYAHILQLKDIDSEFRKSFRLIDDSTQVLRRYKY